MLEDGATNSQVLLRELRRMGYTGGRTILKDFMKPLRPPRPAPATVRFETDPGQQAQVDLTPVTLVCPDGTVQHLWAFAMVLDWSRAGYLEFMAKADLASFQRCHVHAFEHFGGVPRQILYDNTKLVVLGRDQQGHPIWNPRFLDFALRVGFDPRLCQPYRAQTKGKVERFLRYAQDNFLPSARPTDLHDLNRQALLWCVHVADQRVHGTTHERPAQRLKQERPFLQAVPPVERITPCCGRAVRWAATALSSGRAAPMGYPGRTPARKSRSRPPGSGWRSGQAPSALRCIPGPMRPASASCGRGNGTDP
jgi:transposase